MTNPITDYYQDRRRQEVVFDKPSRPRLYFASDKIARQQEIIQERYQFSHGGVGVKKKRRR